MKLLSFFHKAPEQPLPVVPPILPYAYGCLECDAICNGTTKGRCRACKSKNKKIFHIRSTYDFAQGIAAQQVHVDAPGPHRRGFFKAINGGHPKPLPKHPESGDLPPNAA